MSKLFTRSRSLTGLSVVLLVILSLVLAACGKPANPTPEKKSAPAVAVTGDVVRRGNIEQTLSYSGDLRASNQLSVLAKSTGRIERLLVDVGSKVKAGDTIAQLEQDSANVQLLQGRAALASAEAKLAQIRAGGKVEDVAAAQAALNQQQARLNSLRSGGTPNDVALAEAALEAQQAKLQLMEQGGREESVA